MIGKKKVAKYNKKRSNAYTKSSEARLTLCDCFETTQLKRRGYKMAAQRGVHFYVV